jgi:hypothetical protein
VAGAAFDAVFRFGVGELGEVVRVDGVGHLHHGAGKVFYWIGVGGEVVAAGGGVFGVAVAALYAELGLKVVHDSDDLLSGHVFGQDFEV